MKLWFSKKERKNDAGQADDKRLYDIIENFRSNPRPWDAGRMGDPSEIRASILHRLIGSIESRKRQQVLYRRRIAVAASLLIGITSSFIFFQYKNQFLDLIDSSATIIVTTRNGEQKKILLSDSSVVWLNGNTRFAYPEHFSRSKRSVELLEGEAFFEIRHNPGKPFQVTADKTLTNVLGTSFNINAYKWRETVSITVTTGKVLVNKAVLLPNQQLSYHKASGAITQRKLQAANVISWIGGKLYFNEEDFQTVARILEQKFHVRFQFSKADIAALSFTASFDQTESLSGILDALTLTRGLRYTITNNIVLITD